MQGEHSGFFPWSVAPSALAALVLLVCPLQAANAVNRTAADAVATDSYSDSTGDVQDPKIVPDIAQVTLASAPDDTVTFDVHLAASNDLHSAPPERGLSWIFVAIDTDRNPATGAEWGDLVAYQIGPHRFALRRWDGAAYSDFAHKPTGEQFSGTDLTFTLTLSDLGVSAFDFWVTGGNLGDADRVPNTGIHSYPPAITSLVVPASLLRPRAGRVYRLRGITARLSNEGTAVPDALNCSLAYSGKPLRPLAHGCAWTIAKRYRGKALRLTLTGTYRGGSATFQLVVRPK